MKKLTLLIIAFMLVLTSAQVAFAKQYIGLSGGYEKYFTEVYSGFRINLVTENYFTDKINISTNTSISIINTGSFRGYDLKEMLYKFGLYGIFDTFELGKVDIGVMVGASGGVSMESTELGSLFATAILKVLLGAYIRVVITPKLSIYGEAIVPVYYMGMANRWVYDLNNYCYDSIEYKMDKRYKKVIADANLRVSYKVSSVISIGLDCAMCNIGNDDIKFIGIDNSNYILNSNLYTYSIGMCVGYSF